MIDYIIYTVININYIRFLTGTVPMFATGKQKNCSVPLVSNGRLHMPSLDEQQLRNVVHTE